MACGCLEDVLKGEETVQSGCFRQFYEAEETIVTAPPVRELELTPPPPSGPGSALPLFCLPFVFSVAGLFTL